MKHNDKTNNNFRIKKKKKKVLKAKCPRKLSYTMADFQKVYKVLLETHNFQQILFPAFRDYS